MRQHGMSLPKQARFVTAVEASHIRQLERRGELSEAQRVFAELLMKDRGF